VQQLANSVGLSWSLAYEYSISLTVEQPKPLLDASVDAAGIGIIHTLHSSTSPKFLYWSSDNATYIYQENGMLSSKK
jgi:hypothetical protein